MTEKSDSEALFGSAFDGSGRRLKLYQLRALLAVAAKGSLQAASRSLHVSQPAITKAMQDLEHELKVALLNRSTRGVSLTPAGEVLARHASLIQNQLQQAIQEIDFVSGRSIGELKLGVTSVAAVGPVHEALLAFRRRFPEVRVRVIEARYADLLPMIKQGSVDLAVASLSERPHDANLDWEPLYETRTAVFVARDSGLAHVTRLEDLLAAEWLIWDYIDESCNSFRTLFASHGLPVPEKRLICNSPGIFARLVAQPSLVSFCGAGIFKLPIVSEIAVPLQLEQELPTISVGLLCKDANLLPAAAMEFTRFFRIESRHAT